MVWFGRLVWWFGLVVWFYGLVCGLVWCFVGWFILVVFLVVWFGGLGWLGWLKWLAARVGYSWLEWLEWAWSWSLYHVSYAK